MSKITRSEWSRELYVRSDSPTFGGMTALQLRDFARALDEAGVPDTATIRSHWAYDTQNLLYLSVRVAEKQEGTDG